MKFITVSVVCVVVMTVVVVVSIESSVVPRRDSEVYKFIYYMGGKLVARVLCAGARPCIKQINNLILLSCYYQRIYIVTVHDFPLSLYV